MLGTKKLKIFQIFAMTVVLSWMFGTTSVYAEDGYTPELTNKVKKIEHSNKAFRPDPTYEDKPYSAEEQIKIYGGKKPYRNFRPLLELGRPLYPYGLIPESPTFLGMKNPLFEHFMIFGDVTAAVAYNVNGKDQQSTVAFELVLDFDFQFTATERLFFEVRPLDDNGEFTRWEFEPGDNTGFDTELDFIFDRLFFEGDVGAMLEGFLGVDVGFDMPIAVGLIPLLFHNNIWVDNNDAFTGFALTIPALNSPALDISNMDITFFAGFDRVNSQAIAGNDEDPKIFAVNLFMDMMEGHWEIGYGYTYDHGENDFDYHNLMVSFTRRYGGIVSNSMRVIWNFGQKADDNVNGGDETAEGVLLLMENSLVTHLPSTLVPYFNLFAGFNNPQKLVGDNLLFQTGINFETDGLTGFPRLDDTAKNTYGGALGVSYLFNLDKQLVLEFATVQELEGGDTNVQGEQYAWGLRIQLPVNLLFADKNKDGEPIESTYNTTIFRVDAMYAILRNDDDIHGVRFEVRQKF